METTLSAVISESAALVDVKSDRLSRFFRG